MKTEQVNVRYMVDDVDNAIEFYTKHLGFKLGTNATPAFADVTRGNLRLLLSGRKSSAGKAMPDGTLPVPGGWNRIELVVKNLSAEVEKLRSKGLHFRNDIQIQRRKILTFTYLTGWQNIIRSFIHQSLQLL